MINFARRSCVFVAVFASVAVMQGQETSGRYRDYQLGASLTSIATLSGAAASEAKTVRDRPVMLKELEWRRPYAAGSMTDTVQQITFSFYNDELYQVVVDYDREKTEGLTDADVIGGMTTMYGAPLKPAARPASTTIDQIEQESGTRIARWGNAEFSAVLYRTSYEAGVRLVVRSTPLTARVRTAITAANKLDEQDAPQRERARQKKEAADARTAREKARIANKATFVP